MDIFNMSEKKLKTAQGTRFYYNIWQVVEWGCFSLLKIKYFYSIFRIKFEIYTLHPELLNFLFICFEI